MAKKAVERFYTHIKQEGTEGATRGKVPVAMARAMGAKDGSVIEWEVVNGECTGGRILSKSELKALEKEQRAAKKSSAPAKKAGKKVKPSKRVAKDSEDEAPARKVKSGKKKLKKPSKRTTKVSYDEAPKKGKKGKKKLKKPGKKFHL